MKPIIILALILTLFASCNTKEVKKGAVLKDEPTIEGEAEVSAEESKTTNEKGENNEKENIAILENDPICPEGWKRFVDYLHKYKICFPKEWTADNDRVSFIKQDYSQRAFYTGQYPYDDPMLKFKANDYFFDVTLHYNIEKERQEIKETQKEVTGNILGSWEKFIEQLEEGRLYFKGEGTDYTGAYGQNGGYYYSLGTNFGEINKEKSLEYFHTAVKTFEFLQ